MLPKGELREGYIARWNKYPNDEVKIRVARPSVLGPSKELLSELMTTKKRLKEGGGKFKDERCARKMAGALVDYEKRFRKEIAENAFAQNEMAVIREMLNAGINVRLLCYEKEPPCHRFILMDLILGQDQTAHKKMDRNLERIKAAGLLFVGEHLPRLKSTPKKPKGPYYPKARRWFR